MEICENIIEIKTISNENEKYQKSKIKKIIIKTLHSRKIKKSQYLNELYIFYFI